MLDKARTALLEAYHNIEDQLTPDELDRRRDTFLAKYSPDLLITLSGNELLEIVHGNEPRSGLFYDLEFADVYAPFGSISGGSALKFKVYKAADGSGYKKKGQSNVPVPCSDAEAVRMTTDIVGMLHKVSYLTQDYRLTDSIPDLWKQFELEVIPDRPSSLTQVGHDAPVARLGWAHKYFAICQPNIFSFHHQPRQLAGHLVRLGETPTNGDSRYLLDFQWVKLRYADREIARCHPVLLMNAAYQCFGNRTKFWRTGTEQHERQNEQHKVIDRWPEMQRGGFASIGWAFLGDLRDLLAGLEGQPALERLKQVLASHERYNTKPVHTISNLANQIYKFYARMSPGDRIIAMQGERLLGVGEITGDYTYVPNDIQPHHRPVRWHAIELDVWRKPPGFLTTIYDFTERYADAVRVEKLLLSSDPIPSPMQIEPSLPDQQIVSVVPDLLDAVPFTQLEQRIKDILDRKGQVILYGPPGTGKTYHARQAARELVAREVCGGRAWAMLNEEERHRVDASTKFITFHPAYAYEDFIEGYRPVAAQSGAPAFELRDGVFLEICDDARQDTIRHRILLIDEINRGNVAAIMGELITLLEGDKRDDVAAVLPLSRRAFRIPKNVWIIGTMNTADRSISLLDAALRRRFGFVELLPEPDRIAVNIEGLSLSALLTEINARIRKHVARNARELQVGHAYLMRAGQPLSTKEDLLAAFRDDILPLLAEYCFENYSTLGRILGDEIIDIAGQIPNADVLSNPPLLHRALRRLVSADPARLTELGTEEDNEETETTTTQDNLGEDAEMDLEATSDE